MKKRHVKVGDKITVRRGTYDDSPWTDAIVTDLLSVQFVCVYEHRRADGGVVERIILDFYKDEGESWKFEG